MYYLGIDIGSLSCDAVLVDDDEKVIASSVVPTGARNRESIERVTADVLRAAGIAPGDVRATVSTGYGRDRVDDRLASVTEITCHARGIAKLAPGTRLLVDIGGQDSKAILLAADGRVADFAMNDKCAAGTGRFLEAMARALQVDIDEMGSLAEGAMGRQAISSMCTVFAESEVVSLIADGTPVREIVHGINRSIAARIMGMVKRLAPDHGALPAAMSGGVARNSGVVSAIRSALGADVAVPAKPDTVGALGAALIARERCAERPAAVS